ncbi:single-stranded-DNA-specific exonuclease RecJ [Patescibacteria group bacterium]|nr:single-stranded-DNA-specific exonuclease RecJ [Patescibacteria group bacterium]
MKKYSVREEITDKAKKELEEYTPFMQELLFHRGITERGVARTFLNPDYVLHCHDPFLIKGMGKAVRRILRAVKNSEKIVIYSDYDCDGIPGGVILHDFFKKIGYKNFSNYIPHRHEEGYGVNISAIEKIAKEGATLMITVDVGITDVKPVERANELKVDVIITDHHLPSGKLPPAYTILNSKQKDDSYPFDELCGAGVAFKLVQGLLKRGNVSAGWQIANGWEKWLLDMTGLSTIADMVPLRGENRVFAYYGLKVLRKSRRPGLQQLCRKLKMDQRYLTEDDIGFMIAPRINAASRMDHPMDAFRLLATEDEVEAGTLSDYLNKINDERKGMVASMIKEMKKRLKQVEELREVIVIGDPRWRPPLLGLAANSIVEEYGRPVFIWGREGGDVIKGSCRSDGSVNVVELMEEVNDVFIDSGGHKFSGGFSVKDGKIHILEETLLEAYKNISHGKTSSQEVMIDKKLSIHDVDWRTYKIIEQLAPFGEGNHKPLFLFEEAEISGVKHFGKEGNHLRLTFKNGNRKDISAVGFFLTSDSFDKKIEEGEKINLVANIEKSTFRNFPELRLRIVDIF